MIKIKDTQFCVKNLEMKRKKDKKISNPRFSVIFMEGEGEEIKYS